MVLIFFILPQKLLQNYLLPNWKQDFVKVILTEIQMLSAPVCRQAGWLNAECRMQIEKCKIAFCQIGTLECWKWELGNGNWEFLFSIFCFLFSVSRFPFLLFLLYAR